ncbi:MAG: SadB/YajI family lipoprotein [Planctomycetota bacterium]
MNTKRRIMNIEYRVANHELRNSTFLVRHSIFIVLLLLSSAFCLLSVTGCQSAAQGPSLVEQVEQLTQERAQLQEQIEQCETQNRQLGRQVETLAGLPEDVRLESLYSLKSVKIGRYSGFYDKDKDGKNEKLIVYIRPIDEEGDEVKAGGTVDVQLWDLNKADNEALLGEWRVQPDELKEVWYATLVTINYRLMFDIADKVDNFEHIMTVKVTFTDYLTGKVFKVQRIIKPRQK